MAETPSELEARAQLLEQPDRDELGDHRDLMLRELIRQSLLLRAILAELRLARP